MKNLKFVSALIMITGLGFFVPFAAIAAGSPDERARPSVAQSPTDKQETSKPSAAVEASEAPLYNPPLRGVPGRRTAGGSRGVSEVSAAVSVLAPDHVGLTTQDQPSLYWFLSESTNCPIEFSIIEAMAIKPLMERRINQPIQWGINRIRLADYGLKLKPGIQYHWFVAILRDPDQRSKDSIAGGWIELVALREETSAKLLQADKRNAPFVYAQAGLWYDAVSAISELIASSPGDVVYRKHRVALLRQVGLTDVAEFEAKH